jgi:hypothetical protein
MVSAYRIVVATPPDFLAGMQLEAAQCILLRFFQIIKDVHETVCDCRRRIALAQFLTPQDFWSGSPPNPSAKAEKPQRYYPGFRRGIPASFRHFPGADLQQSVENVLR